MIVLQISADYGLSSTGRIVGDIQRCCIDKGIDAYVAYSIPRHTDNAIKNAFRIGNYCTEKWQAFCSRLVGKQSYYNRLTTLLFLRWVKRIQPDIVHLHNLHSNYIHLNYLLRFLAKYNIATVITMHDCWYFTGGCFHYSNAGCNRWQSGCGHCPKRYQDTPAYLCDSSARILKDRKRFLNAIPRLYIVGCSRWVADEAKKSVLRNCNIRHIYNGFDLDVFKPSPSDMAKRLGIEGKFILLGPASKWQSEVNKETLEYFVKTMPSECVLVLFGAKNNQQTVADNVMLYGYTHSREEMAQLYSMADVMVNCSREDTLSSLNLEAQACGTPVVTYEATGSKETVDGKCGFAVETGNPQALWNAVLEVLSKGKQSFTDKCCHWINNNFEKETNYNKYIELYREIANNN